MAGDLGVPKAQWVSGPNSCDLVVPHSLPRYRVSGKLQAYAQRVSPSLDDKLIAKSPLTVDGWGGPFGAVIAKELTRREGVVTNMAESKGSAPLLQLSSAL